VEVSEARAYAKINLRHRVFAPDQTGLHSVETLLLRTGLFDSVGLAEAPGGCSVDLDGEEAAGVPSGEDNLCCRAARLYLDRAFGRTRPGVRIRLTKRIPPGSGLGGGSADAAAVLRLLTGRWPRLDERELVRLAGEIGSDVPFALIDVPMALGWEHGRRLLPLRPPRPRPALLARPPFSIDTGEAYADLAASRTASGDGSADPGGAAILPGADRLSEWDSLARLARNDLEPPALASHPDLADCLAILRADAPVAGMTGSGSTLFGIFASAEERAACRERCERAGFDPERRWRWIETTIPHVG
jgi:4-diphosphocytidyl-2-C-methyl-D-erythritol kinase